MILCVCAHLSMYSVRLTVTNGNAMAGCTFIRADLWRCKSLYFMLQKVSFYNVKDRLLQLA